MVDSLATDASGGDGYVVLESAALRLKFTVDRGQMLLEVQSTMKKSREWYSIDLIRQLVTGEAQPSAVFDAQYSAFLREHRGAICDAFSVQHRRATLEKLAGLEKDRERRMFGHSKQR